MSQSTNNPGETSPSVSDNSTYPPQLHTGAVGLGPEFGKGASVSEKIEGLKQEIKGKIKHDPELVEHGREQRTGQLKRKEMRAGLGPPGQSGEAHPDEEQHQQEPASQEQPDEMSGHSGDK